MDSVWAYKSELCTYLQHDDTFEHKAIGVAITTAAWYILLGLVMIVSKFLPFVQTLAPKDHMPWNLRIVRSVAGFYGAYHGMSLVFTDKYAPIWADPVLGHNGAAAEFMKIVLGFFILELTMYYYVAWMYNRRDSTLLIHHILGTVGYGLYLYYGRGYYFGIVLFAQEFSAPWTGVSWILAKKNKPHTVIWLINQWILVVVWVVFRMADDYLLLWSYFANLPRSYELLPIPLQITLFVGTGTMALYLNPYWMKVKLTNALNWSPEENKNFRKRE